MGVLNPNDPVAISCWIISISMVASTVFFLMESMAVDSHWATSMNVGALVTLVAAVHYFYMREFWVQIGTSPILYRYIDWSITVPLQMIEFYLILSAVKSDLSQGMFWRLLLGTVAMLTFGYAGETQTVSPMAGFVLGMSGWGFILFEIFAGEAGKIAGTGVSENVKASFGHALHRLCGLVHLPSRLLLRIPHGRCCRLHSELGLQSCRLCEQDCILPCHLGICKEGHYGEGRQGSTSVSMSRWEFWKLL